MATRLIVPTLLLAGFFFLLELKAMEAEALVATDQSQSAGIYELTRSWSANVHDFNNDGWPDVLLVRHAIGPARLYRNRGGYFSEVNAGTFSRRDRHDCAWGDVNQDRLPDVYCTIGAQTGAGVGQNELWIQQRNGTFIDRAAAFGVTDPYGRGRFTTFIDVNRDSYPDLFVSNMSPREDGIPAPNRLFINQNGALFRDAPAYRLNEEVGGRCAQAADYNNDGWEDLLVCPQAAYSLKLYRNNKGSNFTEVGKQVGLTGSAIDAVLVDLDGDGLLDLATVTVNKLSVQLQKKGVFQPPTVVKTLVSGVGIAAGDVNQDALPDLYVVQQGNKSNSANEPDVMLLNRGGKTFAETRIPQTTQGLGQHVAAIDYDDDGNTDFIVLNGFTDKSGPVQLIRFR